MGGILYTILIGAVIGVLARFLRPGADPMGWILTILVGMLGAWVGGYVSGALGIGNRYLGFAVSIACAIVLLFIYGMLRRKSARA